MKGISKFSLATGLRGSIAGRAAIWGTYSACVVVGNGDSATAEEICEEKISEENENPPLVSLNLLKLKSSCMLITF